MTENHTILIVVGVVEVTLRTGGTEGAVIKIKFELYYKFYFAFSI